MNIICKIFGHKLVTIQTFRAYPKPKLYKPSIYCKRCDYIISLQKEK